MTQHEFLNRIRSLYNIEPSDIPLSKAQAQRFNDDPVRFLIRADDTTAASILAAIEARQRNSLSHIDRRLPI